MYAQFLSAVLHYINAFDAACGVMDESDGLTPYVNYVPVLLEGELCGFLIDETDGAFAYEPCTLAQRDWWEERPT